jgi:hypothetical protein
VAEQRAVSVSFVIRSKKKKALDITDREDNEGIYK